MYSVVQAHIRTNEPLKMRPKTKAIVMHYTATPGATAVQIRNGFERLQDRATAHYAIDWTGSIIEALPADAVAWHCGTTSPAPQMGDGKPYTARGRALINRARGVFTPNYSTVGIELCHQYSTGALAQTTLNAAAWLVARLLKKYRLPIEAVTTHYEIVGWKLCPKWFINGPEYAQRIAYLPRWRDFLGKVERQLEQLV